MKKYLILFLPIFIFAYEVNFSKNFTQELLPNILSADITVAIEAAKEREVIDRLAVFDKEIKKYKKVEKKLGSFNVRPLYQHSNTSPKIRSYKGELRYEVSTNDALFMGELVSIITKLKDNRDTSISLENLSWKVKKETYNIALDILRLETINWAENYAKTLSQDLKKVCEIKSINFSNYADKPIFYAKSQVNSRISLHKDEMVVPEVAEEDITIKANFRLDCK